MLLLIHRICKVLFVLICLFLSAVILLQEGKSAGLGAIGGMAESYYGRIKGRTMEGKLEQLTKIAAVLWFVFAFILNLKIW